MIAEDYVSYEVAKLLEEKGFPINEHLFMYVNKDDKLITDHQACLTMTNEEYRTFFDDYIPTVTQSLAMKWLREEHKLSIEISSTESDRWMACVYELGLTRSFVEAYISTYDTYKVAVEAALKYSLKNLKTKRY